jgi:hypothetical protein
MVRELPTHLVEYDSDYLLKIADDLIKPNDFFKNFNLEVNSQYYYPTLVKYTERKIKYGIYDLIREETGLETIGRSNLGLASRASKKKVQDALKYQGYTEVSLSKYLQIWCAFDEFRKSTKLPVNQYNNNQFQEIAARYRQRNSESVVDGEEIKEILNAIGEAIRRLVDDKYAYRIGSIDDPDKKPWLENQQNNFVFQDFFTLEENSFFREYSNRLKESLNFLLPNIPESEDRKLLFCRHGLRLNQWEIVREFYPERASQCRKYQYLISRRLARVYKHFWFQLIDWVQQNMNQEFPLNSISTESRKDITSDFLEYLTIPLNDCYETQITEILNSSKLDLNNCLIQKIQAKFNIVLSQYLKEKVLLWLEN